MLRETWAPYTTLSMYFSASHYFQPEELPENVVAAHLVTLNGFIPQDLYSLLHCHLQTVGVCSVTLHRSSPWCKKDPLILPASFSVPSSCTETGNGQSLPLLSMLHGSLQPSIIFPLPPSWEACYQNQSKSSLLLLQFLPGFESVCLGLSLSPETSALLLFFCLWKSDSKNCPFIPQNSGDTVKYKYYYYKGNTECSLFPRLSQGLRKATIPHIKDKRKQ